VRLLFFTFAISVVFLPLSAHSQTGCLSGVVVDYRGQPIKGMRVGVARHTWNGDQQPAGSAVTDESGAFEIDDIPLGNYELGASSDVLGYPGKLPLWQVTVAASGPCTTLTYNAGPRAAKLKFTVTDAVSHKPVAGLTVHVSASGQQGSWLPIGEWVRAGLTEPPQVASLTKLRIEIAARGYSSTTIDLPALKPGEIRELVAQIHPKNLGCITGTAIDDSFAPVKGTTIDPRLLGNTYAGDQTPVQTDEKGRFRVDRLRPGDYDLYPENEAADGFSHLWVGWLNQPALPKLLKVTVPATSVCENVTVNMGPRGAWMNLVAIDANTQETLSNLVVTLMNSEHSRQGGSVVLAEPTEVLVPSHARFTVQVRAEGYRASEPVQIEPLIPGERKTLTVPLRRELAPR
jgi:hypothetical protein